MGSVGASKVNAPNYKEFNDADLQQVERILQDEFNMLNDRLAELARNNQPTAMPEEYYSTKTQQENARKELNKIRDEIAGRREPVVTNNQGTGVNSFGERTNREITNATYNRSQKRLARQIMRFIGG